LMFINYSIIQVNEQCKCTAVTSTTLFGLYLIFTQNLNERSLE